MGSPPPDPTAQLAILRAAVAARPDDAQAHFALGNALFPAGERAASVTHLRRATELDPTNADAHNNLGNALTALGETDQALIAYATAIALRPELAELHYNQGNALLAAGRTAESEAPFRAAIARRADHAGAHNNLGNALRAQGRHQEAIESYQRALTLRPDYFGTSNNIGSVLLALHRPDEAIPWFRSCLEARPDYTEACNNLGGALLALDDIDEALIWFNRALALDPTHAQARFGRGLAHLAGGNFAAGWPDYEARWDDPGFRADTPDYNDTPWRGGEDIAGKTILIHAEQGLGDTIQFARYLPLLRARGAHVILQAQEPLLPLLAPLADTILPATDPPPTYDLRCPLLSLPFAFNTTLETIPAPIPYLAAPPGRLAHWRAKLGPRTRPRIGLAWSGSEDHPDDLLRSLPAATLLAALVNINADLHAIQKDIRDSDRPALANITNHTDSLTDFAETAALIANLDLVISVDTSIAHLAGAIGIPTRLLLQHAADFRWLRNRNDTPWYPTVRLYRQTQRNEWRTVLTILSNDFLSLPLVGRAGVGGV